MSKAYSNFSTKKTPQSEPVPGKNMVKNAAGGYVFDSDKWTRLLRFLILGSEGGTYYTGEKQLTKENALNVMECIKEDGHRTVSTIIEVSSHGRAPSNDPALFALSLAMSFGNNETKKYAEQALPSVARIGTHLFHFAEYAQNQRGWGRVLKRAIANWYQDKDLVSLAHDVVKYKQRDGWSHADLLRKSHPVPDSHERNAVYKYIVDGLDDVNVEVPLPETIVMTEELKHTTDVSKASKLIADYHLPREVVPTELLKEPKIWEALLQHMPMTAMLRNINKMTSVGLLTQLSDATRRVVETVTNVEALNKSRVHPITILVAMRTYAQGHGDKGSLSWNPVQKIVDALDDAFYLAFGNIEPFNGNIQLALDASGSMTSNRVSGLPLTVLEGAAVMALATAKTEQNYVITAYDTEKDAGWHRSGRGIWPLEISPNMRLDSVINYLRSHLRGGGTDSSLPFKWAMQQKETFDGIYVYSDNETWAGAVHPFQLLAQYRRERNPKAKFVGVAMTSVGYQTNEPTDNNSLSVVGFDSAAPQIISDFMRGQI